MQTKNKGFTLIELMIVIAIIGILVSIVLPGYRNYILESQRTDTQGQMLQMLELQERFFIDRFRYTTTLNGSFAAGTGLGYATDPVVVSYNGTAAFNIAIQTCPVHALYPDISVPTTDHLDRCFRIIATPVGNQVNDGGMVIDNRGRKVLDYQSEQPQDWAGNNLGASSAEKAAACPECSSFPAAH